MTLSTWVAIGRSYNVHEIYEYGRRLLDTPDNIEPETGRGWIGAEGTTKRIGNPGGIGLAAWLNITYGADGPIRHQCDEWCATELGGKYDVTQDQIDDHARTMAEDPTYSGWAAIVVDFDTAYGYRGDNGESCSDLHARLVTALGRWLDQRGLPWKWRNEYTGEWFDRFEQLAAFGNAHRATGADEWFRTVVAPTILGAGGELA